METMGEYLDAFSTHAFKVMTSVLDPDKRIYFLYLATSVLAAFLVYRAASRRNEHGSFLRFLFPAHVWRHPSAWLDLRYFVFHSLIGHFLMIGLSVTATVVAFEFVAGKPLVDSVLLEDRAFSALDVAITVCFAVVSMMLVDFVSFLVHYMQHKLPILWQFHKVHHSAEVMHPISNFREHPVDNFVYQLVTGLSYGAIGGVAVGMFGYLPSVPSLLGVPVLMLVFNLLAYNLRHSHIWLRWPGRWSAILPSPAHHHVHHSCHPDHIDKNFAFMFPVWDVLFKTYCMPADNRDVKFGIGEGKAAELTTCLRLYLIPFRDAWRLIREDLATFRQPRRVASPISADAAP